VTSVLSRGQLARASAIATVAYPVIALLSRTLRWSVTGFEHYEAIRTAGRQPIFAFWHGCLLPAMYFWRHRGIVVMTSANFDGEWSARISERFGYGTARGSTSRGGRRAFVQLRREMHAGRPVAFTVDGPRGPVRTVQPGAVWLASLTGNPILPFHIETKPHWSVPSWDRTQVPRPLSRVAVAIGREIDVPMDSDDDVLETMRAKVEYSLIALASQAMMMLGRRR